MAEMHYARLLDERISARGELAALRWEADGAWRDMSWRTLGEEVRAAARALVAAGVKEGDRVGILAPNRPEWTVADLAIQRVRAVSVPIHVTSTSEQAAWILRDAGAVLLVAGRDEAVRIASVRGGLPELRQVVSFDGWRAFLESASADGPEVAEVAARLARASGEDLLTLIYTSGTTGEPKGVMLTHAAICAAMGYHDQRLPDIGQDDVSLCFLPLSHVFERAWTFYVLYRGAVTAYCEDPKKVVELLPRARPTLMCAVPRLYEKIYAAVLHRVETGPAAKRALFRWALRVGGEVAALRREEKPLSPGLALEHRLADRFVLRKVRDIVGGRARMLPCAGAPLSREVEEFFHAVGLFLCQGYGLTETTATVSCYEASRFTTGTVGKPLPGVEVRISPEGEILVRGETVMTGYYKNPQATAEAFLGGWLRTGDAGKLLADGSLVITERIKDLFKTSGGKYVAPQLIEATLGADRFIEQAAVLGDGRRFVTALIVPSFEALEGWARTSRLAFGSPEELVSLPEVTAFYRRRIDAATRNLSKLEQVARFTLLARPLTVEGGEITATLKVRRRVAAVRYADEIEAMYREESSGTAPVGASAIAP